MKKKWLFIVGLVLVVIVLSLSKKTTTNEVIVDTEEVIYEDVIVVNHTSNLFSIIGLKTSQLIEKSFSLVFSIINKLLEFAFGI